MDARIDVSLASLHNPAQSDLIEGSDYTRAWDELWAQPTSSRLLETSQFPHSPPQGSVYKRKGLINHPMSPFRQINCDGRSVIKWQTEFGAIWHIILMLLGLGSIISRKGTGFYFIVAKGNPGAFLREVSGWKHWRPSCWLRLERMHPQLVH
jgi:hypothetical protein